MLSNTLRLNFCYLKTIQILHSRYYSKLIGHILKYKKKNNSVCIHEIIRLIIMKMKMKIKNRSYRYDISRFRHGHKYSTYKKCLRIMMLICIKQHLSYIWSSIHRKVKQHCGWVEKSIAYKKKRVAQTTGLYYHRFKKKDFSLRYFNPFM